MKILIVRDPEMPYGLFPALSLAKSAVKKMTTLNRLQTGLKPILRGQEIFVFDESFVQSKLDGTYADLKKALRENGFNGLSMLEIDQVVEIFSTVLANKSDDWMIVDSPLIGDEYSLNAFDEAMETDNYVIIFEDCQWKKIPLKYREGYQRLRNACLATRRHTFLRSGLHLFLNQVALQYSSPPTTSEDPALVGLTEP